MQLLTEMDGLIEWFADTERHIADSEPLTGDLDRLREQQSEHKVTPLVLYILSKEIV